MPWQFRRRLRLLVALGCASHAASLSAHAPAERTALGNQVGQDKLTTGAKHNLGTVHVVYASDFSLTTNLLAGMTSVGRNLKDPGNCVIHLIVPPQKMTAASELAACFSQEMERTNRTSPQVRVHEVKTHPIDIAGRFTYFGHAMGVTRLFLQEYLPEVPRAIWLDTDTIVTTDLGALYRMPMDHPVAAVREGAPRTFRVLYPTQNWGMLRKYMPNPDLLVFNAGVMLFDLERWGSEAVRKDLQTWARRVKNAGPQLLLNLVCQAERNFTELDPQWNVFGLGGLFPPRLEQAQQARILHWSGMDKPWNRHPRAMTAPQLAGALHKTGVRLPDLGREKFDYLLLPYLARRRCDEPAVVPL